MFIGKIEVLDEFFKIFNRHICYDYGFLQLLSRSLKQITKLFFLQYDKKRTKTFSTSTIISQHESSKEIVTPICHIKTTVKRTHNEDYSIILCEHL